jgi:hypothetical protein
MQDFCDRNDEFRRFLAQFMESTSELPEKLLTAGLNQAQAMQTYWCGMFRYLQDFMAPSWGAFNSFMAAEREKNQTHTPWQSLKDYMSLWEFNLLVAEKAQQQGLKTITEHFSRQMQQAFDAWLNTIFPNGGEDIVQFAAKRADLMKLLVYTYPEAIKTIEPEYGFHFDDGRYIKVAETERFYLYQVLPRDENIPVQENGKPILIIPPYVLGPNIMAFLPDEQKSFVHCFANQGIPTYFRIVKDIATTEAVQVMTGEDDCRDTRLFCEAIQQRQGRALTLCGYCQGGFTAVVNLLSGELDNLVDALITCVAPMDGTRSQGLVEFLHLLPERFRDMGYATKMLPNGNRVVDGKLMSWVYKLKSLDQENPITAFHRDLKLLERGQSISKTAAAINYWLLYDIRDLPGPITMMSYDSYTIPVTADGTLPVKLFGRELNFKRIKEKNIPWLICCAEADDLVEKESAVAPLDWVEAEVAIFPKGHAAMATSWSLPTSECSLDRCFLDYRGPVRFHLDLEEAQKPKAVEPAAPEPSGARAPKVKSSETGTRGPKSLATKKTAPAKTKKPAKSTSGKTTSRKAD